MDISEKIQQAAVNCLQTQFGKTVEPAEINLQETRKDFEGQVTLVTFPLSKLGIGRPDQIAEAIGSYLKEQMDEIADFNVVKGFLNLVLSKSYWTNFFHSIDPAEFTRTESGNGKRVVVEYSSPNTNKPLHLGHLRNNFLGESVCRILEANGYDVIRACLNNDRGIAICKTMVVYRHKGEGKTPESEGIKGDHFVVQFYVDFGNIHNEQFLGLLIENGVDPDDAAIFVYGTKAKLSHDRFPNTKETRAEVAKFLKTKGINVKELKESAPIMKEAREMLLQWEAGDEEVLALWKQMNDWVYDGFAKTYQRIGSQFDKFYYESETYLLGNDIVREGLDKDIFYQKDDSSVWIDLEKEKLGEKAILRSDGTSMYITQDIGTAEQRYSEYKMDKSVYVVADEQDFHFKVLFAIMDKLGREFSDGMFHLSYGMVDLPGGRMKTREGTVVDADILLDEMVSVAKSRTEELGKTEGMSEEELNTLFEDLALAALKFFILRVGPKKRMVFNPEESIDEKGDSGPFVQYSHARVASIARNATSELEGGDSTKYTDLSEQEINLLHHISRFPAVLQEAGAQYDPSLIAGWVLDLAKEYNRFYYHNKVLVREEADRSRFRLELSSLTGKLIKEACRMLGFAVPEQM